MNRLADFNKTCINVTLGHEELIMFGDLDLIFKITAGHKLPNLSKKCLSASLSLEPLAGMLPNLHVNIIGSGAIAD